MKKRYEKPEIMFESFAISTNIAADCGIKIDTQSSGSCPYVVGRGPRVWNVFYSNMVGVCTTYEDDGDFNGICYHVPSDYSKLFNS